VFLVIGIIVLPKYTGILSLVWGMGACMVVAGFLNVYMIKKHLNIKIPLVMPVVKFLGIALPSAILGKNIYGILISISSNFFALALSGISIVVTFLLLGIVFNVIKINSLFLRK